MYILAVTLLAVFIFVFGSVIGSFLNVVIYRLPKGLSVVGGRSFCPSCKKTLKPYDMVPIFSFLFLRGKCRFCGEKISWRYPAVEIGGGLLALAAVWRFGLTPMALCAFGVFAVLLAVSMIDLDTMTIPNGLQLFLAAAALITFALSPYEPTIVSRLIGAVSVSVPMILICLAIKGGFGGGDIKLMLSCGFLLGWQLALLAGFVGVLFGGIYGVALLVQDKKNRREHFPFGPFLAVGVTVAILYGKELIAIYLKLVGLN